MKQPLETVTPESGDVAASISAANQISNDSIASVVFPWRNRRPLYVARNETGRQVDATSFYLCLLSVFLLSTSLQLICASLWIMTYRIPYVHLTEGIYYVDSVTLILCSALLSIPCSWFVWSSHNNKSNYVVFPLLIALLGISLTTLSAGTSLGMAFKSRIKFVPNSNPPILIQNFYQKTLNETMINTMAFFDTNMYYHFSWNTVQERLKCCGVNSATEWMEIRGSLPTSCCVSKNCLDKQIYGQGCINLVAYELSWELQFMATISIIGFLTQFCTLIFTSILYIKERKKHINIIV